jgi:predicted secreted protein
MKVLALFDYLVATFFIIGGVAWWCKIFVGGSFCFRKESEGGSVATGGTVTTQVQK